MKQQELPEVLEVSFRVVSGIYKDEHVTTTLSAAALKNCRNLTTLRMGDIGEGDHFKPLNLSPLAKALHHHAGRSDSLVPLHTLRREYQGKILELEAALLSKGCASLRELHLQAFWAPDDDRLIEAVATYLRATGAPNLRRLYLGNDPTIGFGCSNTKIALALRGGAAPRLEAITLNYVMMENSLTILANAIKDALFAGLLKFCVEDDELDLFPLLRHRQCS